MNKKAMLCMMILALAAFLTAEENSDLKVFSSDSPAFTFGYPREFLNLPLQGETEIVRLSAPNMFKVPVLVAHTEEGIDELNGTALTRETFQRLKSKTPGVYGFKAVDQKQVTLADGSSAFFLKFTWKWVDGTSMDTTSVFTVKENNLITLTGTAFKDQNLSDILSYLCMTLSTDSE